MKDLSSYKLRVTHYGRHAGYRNEFSDSSPYSSMIAKVLNSHEASNSIV